jgi:hypothetical protein
MPAAPTLTSSLIHEFSVTITRTSAADESYCARYSHAYHPDIFVEAARSVPSVLAVEPRTLAAGSGACVASAVADASRCHAHGSGSVAQGVAASVCIDTASATAIDQHPQAVKAEARKGGAHAGSSYATAIPVSVAVAAALAIVVYTLRVMRRLS